VGGGEGRRGGPGGRGGYESEAEDARGALRSGGGGGEWEGGRGSAGGGGRGCVSESQRRLQRNWS